MKFHSKRDAHDFLDAVRDGMEASQKDIGAALVRCGDVERDEAPFVHARKPVGSWERKASLSPLRQAGVFDGLAA